MKQQWKAGVIEPAGRSSAHRVWPSHRFERRALERMGARGEARAVAGLPGVWVVLVEA